MEAGLFEPRSLEHSGKGFLAVEALSVELVGNDPFFHMADNFSGDKALPILRERPLPADKALPVNPLPGPGLVIFLQVSPVRAINQQPASRPEHP